MISIRNMKRNASFGCLVVILFILMPAVASAEPLSTNAPAFQNNVPDMGGSVVRVFGALILVIGLFLGGVWLFRNWQRISVRAGGAPKLNIIEVKSLGQRQSIYVIGYQQQRMLLASSPAGVTLLSHLPAAEETEAAAPAPTRMSFTDALQQVLTRK